MNPRPYFFDLILALGVAAALGLAFDLTADLEIDFKSISNFFTTGDD